MSSYATPEGTIKKQGREICKLLGIYFFPVQQKGTSNAGIPDDMLNVGGRFVQIEYKHHMRWDKRNKAAFATLPTERQIWHMEQSRKCGGITFVVDDSNINALKEALVFIRDNTAFSIPYMQECMQITPVYWDWTVRQMEQYKQGLGRLDYTHSGVPRFIEGM